MKIRSNFLIISLAALLSLSCNDGVIDEPGNLVPRTVDQDPSIPSITVNGAMLHSEAFGPADGSMVVCIHGGPGGDYRYMLNCQNERGIHKSAGRRKTGFYAKGSRKPGSIGNETCNNDRLSLVK